MSLLFIQAVKGDEKLQITKWVRYFGTPCIYRVFHNECPKQNCLHREEIHFMRANWMKFFTESGGFLNVLCCFYFVLKSMNILRYLMFLRGIRADVKVQLGINFEDLINNDQKQCL